MRACRVTARTMQLEHHHVGGRGERTFSHRDQPDVDLGIAVKAVDRGHVVQAAGVDHLDRPARQ